MKPIFIRVGTYVCMSIGDFDLLYLVWKLTFALLMGKGRGVHVQGMRMFSIYFFSPDYLFY